jgi:hypothetical protein
MSNRRTPTQHLGLPILDHLLDAIIEAPDPTLAHIQRLPNAPDSHGRDLLIRIRKPLACLDETGESGDVQVAVGVGRDVVEGHADVYGVEETQSVVAVWLQGEDADLAVYGAGDVVEAV